MSEKCIARLCRICMNDSHSYSPIYEDIHLDNSMLFEIINDVCQLEVTMGDELPEHICSDCSFKLFEFRKFKMRSHEVQASLQRLKGKIEPEDSCEYTSSRMESFEECIGIEPDCSDVSSVDEEEYDVETTPDLLDLKLSTSNEEIQDINPATPDPLDVEMGNQIEEPLCFEVDVIIDTSDKEQELDLEVTNPVSCATDADVSQDKYLAHEKTGMNTLKTVDIKNLLGRTGCIKGRKTIDDPEDRTSYGAMITCSKSDCVNFVEIQHSRQENSTNEKCECDACREISTSNTIIDKSEFDHSLIENPSNLSQLEIGEEDDDIHKLFIFYNRPISSHNNVVVNKNISESGELKEEKKISSKSGIPNDISHLTYKRVQYCCDYCGKGYHRKYHLRDHITIHTKEKNFQCTICNKYFARKGDLKVHLTVHEKPCHVCTICGKAFRQKGNLDTHLRIHSNERNYSCDLCGKSFIQSSNLVAHLRTHTGERPFLCNVCGKGYKQSTDLKRHTLVHGGIKDFSCEICGLKFVTKSVYKTHMMRHGEEKPFSCDQCDKTFKVREDLRNHLKVHTGLKPFKCLMCDKAFQDSKNLKVHLRIHTGEKPYPCPKCGKCFSQSQSVKRHMKSKCVEKTNICDTK